jgi:hypothetical protein
MNNIITKLQELEWTKKKLKWILYAFYKFLEITILLKWILYEIKMNSLISLVSGLDAKYWKGQGLLRIIF